jgi:hypothetical protein
VLEGALQQLAQQHGLFLRHAQQHRRVLLRALQLSQPRLWQQLFLRRLYLQPLCQPVFFLGVSLAGQNAWQQHAQQLLFEKLNALQLRLFLQQLRCQPLFVPWPLHCLRS